MNLIIHPDANLSATDLDELRSSRPLQTIEVWDGSQEWPKSLAILLVPVSTVVEATQESESANPKLVQALKRSTLCLIGLQSHPTANGNDSDSPSRASSSKASDYNYDELLTNVFRDIIWTPAPLSYLGAKLNLHWRGLRESRLQEIESVVQSQRLTPTELAIFRKLLNAGESGQNRNALLEAAWGKNLVFGKTLDTHIFNLRRKLEPLDVFVNYDRVGQVWKISSNNAAFACP